MVRSYDVFDTCLVRTCGSPLTVYDILAMKIIPNASESQWIDFSNERRYGEQRAREKHIHNNIEEISIEQIYEECDFSTWTNLDKQQIRTKEIEIEQEVATPVKLIKEEIDSFRINGDTIIYISDMYLNTSVIRSILTKHGLFKTGDLIYVSSEVKKTKATGNLYLHIAKEQGINFKSWKHKGDNLISDIQIPKRFGITTECVKHDFTEYEDFVSKKDYSSGIMYQEIIASISKALRLESNGSAAELFASDFIAPMFVPFVFDMLSVAREKGITKLFFFSRDAYIFYIIAQQFKEYFPEIELKYLFVSRKSLYLPALRDINFDNISSMFWNFQSVCAADIIERLGIKDRYPISTIHDTELSTKTLSNLLKDPAFIDAVKSKRDEQKKLALDYFIQEGLGGKCCGVVDLTGTRKCHIALNNILQEGGLLKTFGFYFSVLDKRIPGNEYWAYYYHERFNRNLKNFTFRPHNLFEQYFCITNQKRTSGYKKVAGYVEPVFEDDGCDTDYKVTISKLNENICSKFAQKYSQLVLHANPKNIVGIAFSAYSYFYYVPQIDYLHAFDKMRFSESSIENSLLFEQCGFVTACKRKNPEWRNALIMLNSKQPKLVHKMMKHDYNKFNGSTDRYLTIDRFIGEYETFGEWYGAHRPKFGIQRKIRTIIKKINK